MKRLLPFAVLALTAAVSAADFSVSAITDFVSDVKAAIAENDKDGDGQLNRQELGDRAWMLLALDKDRDGKLSEQELKIGTGRFSRSLFLSRPHEPSKELTPLLEATPDPIRGPQRVRGADHGIGRLMPNAELTTLDGQSARLAEFTGGQGTVIAVLSPSCPVSAKYFPVLARLEKEFAERGIKLLGIAAPGEDDTAALKATGLTVMKDPNGNFLRALGATRSTDAFLLDPARTLIYRGAVDDQYGLGYNLDAPRQRLLSRAADAMLAGKHPLIDATVAPGCELELPAPPAAAPPPGTVPTWHGRISRLVQANCQTCHRDGGVAPFPLETYAQMLKKARTVQRVITEDVMPPWFAPAPAKGKPTVWFNDTALTAEDKADLLAWLENGRPEGDAKEAPRPLAWPEGWSIGTPDQIFQIPQPLTVKAEGTMPYQSITVDTGLTEDKWVTAWEVRPTARANVHHVLIYVYDPNEWGIPGSDERRGHLADYAPGWSATEYPEGFAKALPRGAKLRFEIHYTPSGKVTQDQTMLGLKYAKKKPEHIVEVHGIANVSLVIPPGAANYPQAAVLGIPADVRLVSLTPHMHVRGKPCVSM